MDEKLRAIVDSLSTAMSRRINFSDSEPMGRLIDQHLQLTVLANYSQQLKDLDGSDAIAWLLRRLATVEAGLIALQASTAGYLIPSPENGDCSEAHQRDTKLIEDMQIAPTKIFGVTIACDKQMIGTGFYNTELTADNTPFRWIGPSPVASVFIPKLSQSVRITLSVHSSFPRGILENVRVSLDGGDWAPVLVERIKGKISLIATPQVGTVSHAATMRLDIDAVRSEAPVARGGKDTRELSLALFHIRVDPLN